MTAPGRIFAIVGPSGAGKDTLIAAAREARHDLWIVRRVITRPTETGGEDFEGTTPADFEQRRAAGEFALDWQAHGLSYGIPAAQIAQAATGRDVMFNGSRAVLEVARARMPGLRVIVVTAPDAVLAERLAGRGRESRGQIADRLARAAYALPQGFMVRVVMNDSTPEAGAQRFLDALQAESA